MLLPLKGCRFFRLCVFSGSLFLLFCPLLFCPLQRLLNVQLFRRGFWPHFVSFLFRFLSSLTAFNRSAGSIRREACTHASRRSFYLYGAFFFLERILSGLIERVWTLDRCPHSTSLPSHESMNLSITLFDATEPARTSYAAIAGVSLIV
jgi:hypothetical protein